MNEKREQIVFAVLAVVAAVMTLAGSVNLYADDPPHPGPDNLDERDTVLTWTCQYAVPYANCGGVQDLGACWTEACWTEASTCSGGETNNALKTVWLSPWGTCSAPPQPNQQAICRRYKRKFCAQVEGYQEKLVSGCTGYQCYWNWIRFDAC